MTFQSLSPVFPVSDIDVAVEHYGKLGFEVHRYEGAEPYAFAARDGIQIHLAEVDYLVPHSNTTAVYLYVDDADALYEEWSRSEIVGRLVEPVDTDYGLREGACLDRDANLIRFGSRISPEN